jgi:hypothetical protein
MRKFAFARVAAVLVVGAIAVPAKATPVTGQSVGRLQVDFIFPNLTTDTNLGIFAFPSPSGEITAPFGSGIATLFYSCPTQCLAIDVTSTGFDVRAALPTNGLPPIEFVNGDQAIIKVTTLDSQLISDVSLQNERNVALGSSALVFGDNFFQVNLADAGPISVGAFASFNVTYGPLSPSSVPEPPSLALFGIGLAGLSIVHAWRTRRFLPGLARRWLRSRPVSTVRSAGCTAAA